MKYPFLLIFCLVWLHSHSQKIQMKGRSWNETFSSDEILNPGDDYDESVMSKTNQCRITLKTIEKGHYAKTYTPLKVFVHKEDIFWHEKLILELRVSDPKHGNSSGTVFQQISNISTIFFNTIGEKKNIPIQYKLSGYSVTIPVETYTTEIVYTVLNL